MTSVESRFVISGMFKYNKIYFDYEGYENRFGNARRPALVRHSTKFVGDSRYGEVEESEFFIFVYL